MVSRLFLLFVFMMVNACSPQFVGKDKVKLSSLKNNLPSDFSVTSISATNTSATLVWPAVEYASSYSIEYGTSAGSYSTSVSTTLTSYTFSSLSISTAYYFKVSAINQYGKKSASEVNVTTTSVTIPSVPLSLIATNNGTTPTLSWAAPATGSPTITYEVFRSTSSGGPYTSVGQPTPATSTSFVDLVVAGTNYYYVVYAANSGGSGPATGELAFTPIALFNASMTADISNGAQTLNISWPAVTGATGYDIIYGTSTGTYTTTLANVTSPYALTGLTVNTPYYIRVRAKNATTTQASSNELKSIDATATGSGLAFTINFPFDAGSDLSYTVTNNTQIEFVSGIARLKLNTHDISNSSASFSSGTMSGVAYDSTNSYLRLDTSKNNLEFDASWTPKWSNLVAYYPVNNNWNDYSGNARHGTLSGTSSFTTSNYLGSHAARFLTEDTYIDLGTYQPYSGDNRMTFSAWIKMDTDYSAGDAYKAIFSKESGWGTDVFYFGWRRDARKFYVFSSDSAVDFVTDQILYYDDTWAHITLVLKGTNGIDFYFNGILVGSTATAVVLGPGASTAPVYLASAGGWGHHGDIDEIAVWNTDLSFDEVQRIYAMQAGHRSGQYLSKVFDAANALTWTTISPKTTLPFSKPIIASATESSTNTNYVN